MPSLAPVFGFLLAALVLLGAAPPPTEDLAARGWVWPVEEVRLERPFIAPPHAYGPGHRGADLSGVAAVRSPAAGTVAFAGPVAGRPVLTIDHGDGLVSSFEPVTSDLAVGTPVRRGEVVGTVAAAGHTGPATVHFGVRLHGEYVNPLRLLGGVPRAVLLPCCAALSPAP
ncbi:MAG: M23 family metallopeptidase [Actinobacteria bacterium]|nr:M23 family metallopeptidase [Actinomycetota bacterium]